MSDLKSAPALAMRGVVAGYHPTQRVLDHVEIIANQGQITAILGPNGSGKSTTLRVLSGLLRPREGAVEMEGRDITSDSIQDRLRAGIALLPQGRSTFPHMTVAENLELGAWLLKSNRKRMAESIERAYAQFPILGDRRSVRAGELSGGQQQQLEIARTLLTDPKVILIDEPSVGLSPLLASEVYTHIMRLREEGRTIVLVDQNVEAAIEICDYVYLLEFGRNAENGPRADFAGKLGEVIRGWLTDAGESTESSDGPSTSTTIKTVYSNPRSE